MKRIQSLPKKTWITLGIIGLVALVIVAGILILGSRNSNSTTGDYQTEPAKLGDISVSIDATGTVRPNQTATVYWQTNGKVGNVYFKNGQTVSADTLLIGLDLSSASQTTIQAKVDLLKAEDELEAAKTGERALAEAEIALADAKRAYNSALGAYWERNTTQGTEDQINKTRAEWQMARNKVESLQKYYDSLVEFQDDETTKAQALANLAQAKIDRDKLKRTLNYYEAYPTDLDVEELQANLDKAKVDLQEAQIDYDRVKDGPYEGDILAAEAKVASAQALLDTAELKAPFTGTITEMAWKKGDLVVAGDLAYRIDDLSRMLIDVEISEVDINQICIGQEVAISFDAIPDEEFNGKVTDVGIIGYSTSGTVNYSIIVELANPSSGIKTGMTAVTDISITQMTDVLLVPSRAVRTIGENQYVYILLNGQLASVKISLGVSEGSYSQVLAGDIHEGDLVVLNPPSNIMNTMQSQNGNGVIP